jgi:hypothetical protein
MQVANEKALATYRDSGECEQCARLVVDIEPGVSSVLLVSFIETPTKHTAVFVFRPQTSQRTPTAVWMGRRFSERDKQNAENSGLDVNYELRYSILDSGSLLRLERALIFTFGALWGEVRRRSCA